ncbi:MAG: hypothetical protein IPM02_24615 [Betaproteobacteria bacterium]|nr:hypothetical protein [Betaproteobacteria bacterium]
MQQLAEQIIGDRMLGQSARTFSYARRALIESHRPMRMHAGIEAALKTAGTTATGRNGAQAVLSRSRAASAKRRDARCCLESRLRKGRRTPVRGGSMMARGAQRGKQRRRRESDADQIDKNVEIGSRDDPCGLQFTASAQVNDLRLTDVRRAVPRPAMKSQTSLAPRYFAVQHGKDAGNQSGRATR